MNFKRLFRPNHKPGTVAGPAGKRFGTFGGVFTPDVLTILGVIMYLRLGWVVGNAGFLGAVLIILLAKSITICTGLSMSSITTNIRIGAGGAYSIISKSLGLEAGGSIGIPLYISQTISTALYIIGFTEGWRSIFPGHPPLVVATIVCLGLIVVSYISAKLAIRMQYFIMAIIGLSLLSFLLTPAKPVGELTLVGNFADGGFFRVFAVFFPAVTGIMAGASLSGDLKDPRRSIPLGTMSAILVTMLIYLGLAYILGRIATPQELRTNQLIMVDKALWGPLVIAGLMGATLSSALGSILGAPRTLQAMAEQKIVPFSRIFARKSRSNEPHHAIIVTGVIVEVCLLTGNLNSLATLITMFFLITYGMINLVVFIEQSMKIISFRPTFKIPRAVPLLGTIGCVLVMFLINPVFSFVAVFIVIALYAWLAKKGLKSDWGDIRGGMLLVLAEKASRLSAKFPRHQISWKPDLLLPIDEPRVWAGPLLLIRNITYPSGSIFAFTVKEGQTQELQKALKELTSPLKEQKIFVNSTVIEDRDFLHGAKLVIQTLSGGAFRPNILFLTLGMDTRKDHIIRELVTHAAEHGMGSIILLQHPRMAFGMQKDINLWLRDKSPNWHLALLVTLQLQLNWGGHINLVTVAADKKEERHAHNFLQRLSDQARLPSMTDFHVLSGRFENALGLAPKADINIFGLVSDRIPFSLMRKMPDLTGASCMFVCDSGRENAVVEDPLRRSP